MRVACIIPFLLLLLSTTAHAQLISPGKLTASHADLEGITNCTQCHSLGNRSTSSPLCLDCHTPIANRIEAGTGLHATTADQECADCHKDHFGVEFIPVRFDTLNFDHQDTGFTLTGAHTETSCRGCHQPEYITAPDVIAFKGEHDALKKTFLGADTQCIGCHLPETPHQMQFEGVDCGNCHETEIWEEAPVFDHDEAAFALTGKHVDVSCESCHKTIDVPGEAPYVQYVDIPFASCTNCHEDEHEGAFGSNCIDCHQTSGWLEVTGLIESAFDHAATGFDLVGSHAGLECASCHGQPARRDADIFITFAAGTTANTYPDIPVENCASCHVDYHDGVFADKSFAATSCESCHGQEGWYPSSYDFVRHNEESAFELAGAHLATPCSGCHQPDFDEKPHFEIEQTACIDCHREDSPHGDQFVANGLETACATCHVTDDWLDNTSFDHDKTDFPLTGQHASTTCASCHVSPDPDALPLAPAVFRNTPMACISCHEEDDPHQGQFEDTTCNTCHSTTQFLITSFDHEKTRFPLTGEHVNVNCASCHGAEVGPDNTSFVRFKPLGTNCQDCHGED